MTRTAMLATRILLATMTLANASGPADPHAGVPQGQWPSLDAVQARLESLGNKAAPKVTCGMPGTIDWRAVPISGAIAGQS
ncbi:hypothetical protein [Bradyrhizobium sp.]|uniref:hypothetical protein n=1 Tax=Bradyrhizobium sp. TaxID=376 RepID=UPI001D211008|nr:hypothetical protein [Bradyrhizobium sp.]MBI5320766.1 hypothetical protein [Bradyrhizobium sp.]